MGTWVPHAVIQPFVYVKAFPRVQSQQGIFGTETEVTPGVEASGNLPSGFNFDGLIAVQRGSYSNDSIDSSAGYIKAGYTLQKVFLKPRFLGEYDYASGNTRQNLNKINTFDQQYPSNHNAFGLTDLFGFQNIKQERMNLDLTPSQACDAADPAGMAAGRLKVRQHLQRQRGNGGEGPDDGISER